MNWKQANDSYKTRPARPTAYKQTYWVGNRRNWTALCGGMHWNRIQLHNFTVTNYEQYFLAHYLIILENDPFACIENQRWNTTRCHSRSQNFIATSQTFRRPPSFRRPHFTFEKRPSHTFVIGGTLLFTHSFTLLCVWPTTRHTSQTKPKTYF